MILPTHRVAANVHDFSWPAVRRHLEPWFATEVFAFADDAQKRSGAFQFFSRGSNHQQRGARSVRILRREKASARSICSRFVPARTSAQLLPNVSPLQRELDVVLLHEGILEPALGITPQSVTKEANLTYEREAANALRCG